MEEVAIALGANIGGRLAALKQAKSYFQALRGSEEWAQSSIYSTEPVGCLEGSPDFYNAVVVFDYKGTPQELLRECKDLEQSMGRMLDSVSGVVNAPRPIDADILYFGDQVVVESSLIIPHPRLVERRFVLEPLAEVRSDKVLADQKETITELLQNLDSEEPPLTLVTQDW